MFTLVGCVLVLFLLDLTTSANFIKTLPNVYWNTSNPIFRIDNTDHIIDVNEGLDPTNPSQYDQVNILCPQYEKGVLLQDTEQYVIYAVNKEEYDTCIIRSANPRIIAMCDSPYSFKYFTISFRFFSPMPGALQYLPGEDYYFISTSSKTDLHQRIHGMCRDYNMKLVFKVADSRKEESPPKSLFTEDNLADKPLSENRDSTSSFNEREEPQTTYSFLTPFEKEQESEVIEQDKEKNRKRNKKRKKHRRKQRKNSKKNRSDDSEDEEQIPQDKSSVILLDSDPNEEMRPNDEIRKVSERKPSQVEKVNNYMKHEASFKTSSATNLSQGAGLLITLCLSYFMRAGEENRDIT